MKFIRLMLLGIFLVVFANDRYFFVGNADVILIIKTLADLAGIVIFFVGFVMSFFENKKSNKQLSDENKPQEK